MNDKWVERLDAVVEQERVVRQQFGEQAAKKGHLLELSPHSAFRDLPDTWAVVHHEHGGSSAAWHNGPRCTICGASWCMRCSEIPECRPNFYDELSVVVDSHPVGMPGVRR